MRSQYWMVESHVIYVIEVHVTFHHSNTVIPWVIAMGIVQVGQKLLIDRTTQDSHCKWSSCWLCPWRVLQWWWWRKVEWLPVEWSSWCSGLSFWCTWSGRQITMIDNFQTTYKCNTHTHDAVEAQSCVGNIGTVTWWAIHNFYYSNAGRFNPKVFVNHLRSSWQRPSGQNVLQLNNKSCVLLTRWQFVHIHIYTQHIITIYTWPFGPNRLHVVNNRSEILVRQPACAGQNSPNPVYTVHSHDQLRVMQTVILVLVLNSYFTWGSL